MLPKKLALTAFVMMSLSACSGLPSAPQTIPRQPPAACLTECQPLPAPADGSDLSVRLWEYSLIDAAGACLRLHRNCVDWHRQRINELAP